MVMSQGELAMMSQGQPAMMSQGQPAMMSQGQPPMSRGQPPILSHDQQQPQSLLQAIAPLPKQPESQPQSIAPLPKQPESQPQSMAPLPKQPESQPQSMAPLPKQPESQPQSMAPLPKQPESQPQSQVSSQMTQQRQLQTLSSQNQPQMTSQGQQQPRAQPQMIAHLFTEPQPQPEVGRQSQLQPGLTQARSSPPGAPAANPASASAVSLTSGGAGSPLLLTMLCSTEPAPAQVNVPAATSQPLSPEASSSGPPAGLFGNQASQPLSGLFGKGGLGGASSLDSPLSAPASLNAGSSQLITASIADPSSHDQHLLLGQRIPPSDKPESVPRPLSDMFKPKSGAWGCPGCYSQQSPDTTTCPARGTRKPGSAKEESSAAEEQRPSAASVPISSLASMTGSQADGNEYDEGHADNTYDPYYKPIVHLDLCETRSGEENDEILHRVQRAKLFRFHEKEWKERGIGEAKLLKDKMTGRIRFLMRREMVMKVCANHVVQPDMVLTPAVGSDRAWTWFTPADYTDEEPRPEKLCLKFKNAELANEFKQVFEECVAAAATTAANCPANKTSFSPSEGESVGDVAETGQVIMTSAEVASGAKPKSPPPPLSEMFKLKSGTWECPGCFSQQSPDTNTCPACGTRKPGSAEEEGSAGGEQRPPFASFVPVSSLASVQIDTSTAGFSFPGMPALGTAARGLEEQPMTGGFKRSEGGIKLGEEGIKLGEGGIKLGGGGIKLGGGGIKLDGGGINMGTSQPATASFAELSSQQPLFTQRIPPSFGNVPAQPTVSSMTSPAAGLQATSQRMPVRAGLGGWCCVSCMAENRTEAVRCAECFNDRPRLAQEAVEQPVDTPDPVEFVYERNPTPEQRALAEKFQLPKTFYLYETKPPCPGCRGCGDNPELPPLSSAGTNSPPAADTRPEATSFVTQAASTTSTSPPRVDSTSAASSSAGGFGSFTGGVSFCDIAKQSDSSSGGGWKTSEGNFSFAGAGRQVFGGGGNEDDEGHADDNYDPHYNPIVHLDLCETRSGEENDKILHRVQRAKLFRFHEKEWKERGIGEAKLLKDKTTGRIRFLMRREMVMKVCANHVVQPDMVLTPAVGSDRAWTWFTPADYTDEEPRPEKLCLKFKNAELANEFKQVFEECVAAAATTAANCPANKTSFSPSEGESVGDVAETGQVTSAEVASGAKPKSPPPPLSEMFKPKSGTWECPGCFSQQSPDTNTCPACGTRKPGLAKEESSAAGQQRPSFASFVPVSSLASVQTNTFTADFSIPRMPTLGTSGRSLEEQPMTGGFKRSEGGVKLGEGGIKLGGGGIKLGEGIKFGLPNQSSSVGDTSESGGGGEAGGVTLGAGLRFKLGDRARYGSWPRVNTSDKANKASSPVGEIATTSTPAKESP